MTASTKTQTAAAVDEVTGIHANKLQLIALVGNALTTGAGLYIGGVIVETLTAAAVVLTGAGFISFMVYFIGMIVAVVVAVAAGFFVQNMIIEGDIAKRVDTTVRGWFAPRAKTVGEHVGEATDAVVAKTKAVSSSAATKFGALKTAAKDRVAQARTGARSAAMN